MNGVLCWTEPLCSEPAGSQGPTHTEPTVRSEQRGARRKQEVVCKAICGRRQRRFSGAGAETGAEAAGACGDTSGRSSRRSHATPSRDTTDRREEPREEQQEEEERMLQRNVENIM
uniref:Uncharacterized protein n=1 Tax=Knipowitschia caucasica TaxID=637954 RepID=A0AAV2L3V8_KNICA